MPDSIRRHGRRSTASPTGASWGSSAAATSTTCWPWWRSTGSGTPAATASTCAPGGARARARGGSPVARPPRRRGRRARAVGRRDPGARVERKRFAIAVHFRQVDDASTRRRRSGGRRADRHPGLRMTGGKKIFELRPDVDWDKGNALWWVFERPRSRPTGSCRSTSATTRPTRMPSRHSATAASASSWTTATARRTPSTVSRTREVREFLVELAERLEGTEG